MADSITVDELAINVVAEAGSAAASIDLLTASLSRLALTLGPTLTKLATLGPALARVSTNAGANAAKMSTASALPGAAAVSGVGAGAASEVAAATAGAGTSAVEAVTGAAATGSVLDAVKNKVQSVTATIGTMAKTGGAATKTLGGSFIQLRSTIFFAFFALTALAGVLKVTVGGAIDFIETLNLFQVAMRNNIGEANQFVSSLSAAFGMDPKRLMEYQSTFFQIAESSGIANKNAYALSEVLTRLTLDFASLRNMKIEDVFTKMQGVLTGQARAMRSLGVDVSLTRIKELALSMGIRKNVADMTNAEKTLLRLVAAYQSSKVAQGDMARTLLQPANLLRVLGDQFSITARAIGSLFIPVLEAVVPYIIWFVQAIGQAFTALASFFGVDMSKMAFTIPDVPAAKVADSMGKAAKNTSNAAKSAKAMKNYLLGIDELNVVKPEVSSGGGGGGGGAGGGGAGSNISSTIDAIKKKLAELLTTPFADLMKKIGKSVGDALKPLQPFIDAAKRLWDALNPFINDVWQGFTQFWKEVLVPLGIWTMNTVGVAVLDTFRVIVEWFDAHPNASKTVGALIAAFMALKGLSSIISIVKTISGFFGGILGMGGLSGIVGGISASLAGFMAIFTAGDVTTGIGLFFAELGTGSGILTALATATGIAVGWWALLIAAVIAGVIAIVANWDSIKAGAINLWNTLVGAWNGIAKATAPIWAFIGGIIKTAWGVIKAVVTIPLAIIGTLIITAWNTIKTATKVAWDWVYDKIKGPLDAIMKFLTPTFNLIKTTVKTVWDGLSEGLSKAWDVIRSVFRSGINFLISSINNGPIAILNKIIDAAKAVDKTGLMKGVSHVTRIPYLAAGGSVTQGRMFVAGEAGPELVGSFGGNSNTVMPLENSGFVEAMAKAVYGAVTSAMDGASSGGDGNVYLDGTKVGNVLRANDRRTGINAGLVRVTT